LSARTGVGIKAATQPMRNAPKSRKKAPIKIARVDVSVSNCAVPCDGGGKLSPDQAQKGVLKRGGQSIPPFLFSIGRSLSL
jgi:hypothetical protein